MQDLLIRSIGDLYDCVDRDFDSFRALRVVGQATDETHCFMTDRWPMTDGHPPLAYYNMPEDRVQILSNTKFDIESHRIFKFFELIPELVPILRRSYLSDEEHSKTEMYQNITKPWGIHSEGLTILKKGRANTLVCWFARYSGQEDLDHDLLGRLAILKKHMVRAMSLQHRIDALSEAVVRANRVLDLVDFGLILYGEGNSPEFVNKRAYQTCDDQDGITLGVNGLVLQDGEARKKYDTLLEMVRDKNVPLTARAGGMVRVDRPSGKPPYTIMAVPMPNLARGVIDSANVAVMIFDPSHKKTTAIKLFMSSYDLTNAEAALALELAQGTSMEEFAEKRKVSITTARSQLRSVFAKTDTSRQPQLVSLLLRSVAGVTLD